MITITITSSLQANFHTHLIMETLSIKVSDLQAYFLKEVARSNRRTLQQLLWILLHEGVPYFLEANEVSVKKRHEDFTEEEHEKMARFDRAQEEKEYPLPNDCYVCRYFDSSQIEEVLETIPENVFNKELND